MLTMRRSKQTNRITKNKHTRRRMAFNSNDFFLAHRMGQFDPLLLWGPMSKLKLLWMDFLSIEVHFNTAHVKQTNVKYVQFAFLFFFLRFYYPIWLSSSQYRARCLAVACCWCYYFSCRAVPLKIAWRPNGNRLECANCVAAPTTYVCARTQYTQLL